MDCYTYQAALLLCEDCGRGIIRDLEAAGKVPEAASDEASFDSDDYPKGPFSDGGGEADTPQHCDGCNAFLENDLTSDGIEYVERAIAEHLQTGSGNRDVLDTWAI
jgi:hypothetical protein